MLAWAGPGVDGTEPVGEDLVIGTRGQLSIWGDRPVSSATPGASDSPAAGDPSWTHVGWHRIERGRWDGDARRLSWSGYDGSRGSATVTAPGRVPELFRERIAASIAVEEIVQVGGGRSVVVSGRRDLSHPDGPIEWRMSLGRGSSWQQPGLRALAEDTLARLRSEYDRG